jgi:hypothetical protein
MGMFGQGFSNKLGLIGDVLTGNPVTANRLQAQQAESIKQLQLQQQLAIAQQKLAAGANDPDVIRSFRAAGIDPASPEGRAGILNNYSHPIVLGNPENGQMPIGGAFGVPGQPAGPPAEAVARLRQNPHEAAQFDEIFGSGASARALGQQ